jgi:hypothetical protein
VSDLPIRVPFDEQQWLEDYSAFRGRPITLRYWPIRGLLRRDRLFGFLLLCPDFPHDQMYVERDTRRQHQQLIILHECAHDLLNHPGDPLPPALTARLGLPAGGTIRSAFRRGPRRNWQEFEAETVARLILLRVGSTASLLAAVGPEADRVLELTSYLEDIIGG